MSSSEIVFAKRQSCYSSSLCPIYSTGTSATATNGGPGFSTVMHSGTTSSPLSATSSTVVTTTIQISPSPVVAAVSSTSNAGAIAGSVVGGVVFLVLVVLAILLYLRVRKRKRTPPSSEFINSLKAGAAPVLRLDSGVEYMPALPEKGGGHIHYPPAVPLPFLQDSYYTSPPMQNMKFPDQMMVGDIPVSGRPSVDRPPERFSSQTNDMIVTRHHPSTSVGSRRELWGSDTEMVSAESSPSRQSPPRVDSVLHFAPRFSLEGPSFQPSYLSHSPTSLQPLRRQPE